MSNEQFIRKASLIVAGKPNDVGESSALDLSEAHFRFKVMQGDTESPNNAAIRVYNLSSETVKKIRGEYSRVVLQAGYESNFGVIFDGTIKQFGIGRENATDSYLDILAADGDIAYNFAVINKTLAAGSSPGERLAELVKSMKPYGVSGGNITAATGGILPRGRVLFGMTRAFLRSTVQSIGATWNINGGQVNIVPLTGYLPGEAVVLNALSGLVGVPEQTEEGIKLKCLVNPKIDIGQLIKLDNNSVNQTVAADPNAGPLENFPFNKRASPPQLFATIENDGIYRVLVVDSEGDTRGPTWHMNIVALAVDPATKLVKAYG
jgi:hypothetical protein